MTFLFSCAIKWPLSGTTILSGHRLAVTFIAESYDPEEKIEVLLGVGPCGTAEAALDFLYAAALHTTGKWDSDAFLTDYRSVMSAVVAGRISLSDDIIDSTLLEGRRSSKVMLLCLQCLLVWRPVHVLHISFANYLMDPQCCGTKPWFIDLSPANDTLLPPINAGRPTFQSMRVGNILPQ